MPAGPPAPYGTDEEADAWMAAHPRLSSKWARLDSDRRRTLRTYASGMLDDRITWRGAPLDRSQQRAFPRFGIFSRQGQEVETIPPEIVHATARLALHVHETDTEQDVTLVDLDIRQSGPTQFGGGQIRRVIPSEIIEIIPPDWIEDLRNGAPSWSTLER